MKKIKLLALLLPLLFLAPHASAWSVTYDDARGNSFLDNTDSENYLGVFLGGWFQQPVYPTDYGGFNTVGNPSPDGEYDVYVFPDDAFLSDCYTLGESACVAQHNGSFTRTVTKTDNIWHESFNLPHQYPDNIKGGCMDPISVDYDPLATYDDGSCTY